MHGDDGGLARLRGEWGVEGGYADEERRAAARDPADKSADENE